MVEIDPGTVCVHDGYRTPIAIDGRRSSQRLTLLGTSPDAGEPPLVFAWTFAGAGVVLDEGSPDADHLAVRVDGERPLEVRLTVRNGAGGSATTTRTLSITLPDTPTRCASAADCTATERCEPVGTASVCVAAAPCGSTADCAPCFECDPARALCLPRSPR